MPSPGRPRDPGAHERILEAARTLVGELGYFGVTIEAIADRAGASKATVYRWWPNKAAVVTEAFADRLAAPPAPDTGSVADDALAHLSELVTTLTLLGGPTVVASALAERGAPGQEALGDLVAARARTAEELLARGIDRGELPAGFPVRETAESWAGYVLYRVVFAAEPPTTAELTRLVGQVSHAP